MSARIATRVTQSTYVRVRFAEPWF